MCRRPAGKGLVFRVYRLRPCSCARATSVSDRWRLKHNARISNNVSARDQLMRPPTLLGIGGLPPVLINRALRRVPPPGAFPSRSDRLPVAGTCLEDVAVG